MNWFIGYAINFTVKRFSIFLLIFLISISLFAESSSSEQTEPTKKESSYAGPLLTPVTLYAGSSFGFEAFMGGGRYKSGLYYEVFGFGFGVAFLDKHTAENSGNYGEDFYALTKMSVSAARGGFRFALTKDERLHAGISLSLGGDLIMSLKNDSKTKTYWGLFPLKIFLGVELTQTIIEFGFSVPLIWGNALFLRNSMKVYDGIPDIVFFVTWSFTVYGG